MDTTHNQPALHPYAQRAQMASTSVVAEAGPAQFQAPSRPDHDAQNYLIQKFGDKYTQLVQRYGAVEMIRDEEVCSSFRSCTNTHNS